MKKTTMVDYRTMAIIIDCINTPSTKLCAVPDALTEQNSTDYRLSDVPAANNRLAAKQQALINEWTGKPLANNIDFFKTGFAQSRLIQPVHPHTAQASHANPSTIVAATSSNVEVSLMLHYSVHLSIFGWLCIASSRFGVCAVLFIDPLLAPTVNTTPSNFQVTNNNPTATELLLTASGQAIITNQAVATAALRDIALTTLQQRFLGAPLSYSIQPHHIALLNAINSPHANAAPIGLHLIGSPFQLQVWQALLAVPLGSVVSYAFIAQSIKRPKAVRAVASAIGRNPLSVVIPCHRIIASSGKLGGYYWGLTRKIAIIGYENICLVHATTEPAT